MPSRSRVQVGWHHPSMSIGQQVYVIHGRDEHARQELFTFLRAIGLTPIEWTMAPADTDGGVPQVSDVFDRVLSSERVFIVLLTPDNITQVLFEAGFALARHPDHTVLVEFGEVRRFPDMDGRFKVRLEGTAEGREQLARRLEAIGCEVDLSGADWRSAGNLTPPGVGGLSRQAEPEFSSSRSIWKVKFENFSISACEPTGCLVNGEIINNDESALMLRLKANFYDESRRPVGSASGTVNNLGNTERQAFKLTSFDNFGDIDRVHVYIDDGIEM